MKRLYFIAVLFLITATVFAQIPEKMSYQAVVRNADGLLLTSSPVGMQISILQGGASGFPIFVETQSPVTNENGLVSIEIGGGLPVSGTFQSIDWSSGPFFIKTETDPEGGTNYTISGTSQILSVPFALHAKTAEKVDFTELDPVYVSSAASGITETNITSWDNKLDSEIDGSITNEIQTISRAGNKVTLSEGGGSFLDSVNTYTAGSGIDISGFSISVKKGHYVGELYMEGIVFFVDHTGAHGLIANLQDLDGGTGVSWSDVTDIEIGAAAQSATDGVSNTDAIINQQMVTSAAQLCRDLGPEWYLPSNRELYLLFSHEVLIDQILDNDGDPSTNGLVQEKFEPTLARYWSSTEHDNDDAWSHKASSGDTSSFLKSGTYRVRAIRAF